MSVTAEKRGGKLTGWWRVDVVDASGHRCRDRFETKAAADLFHLQVTVHGFPLDPSGAPKKPVHAFRDVWREAERAGGPKASKGRWKRGRNRSGDAQRKWLADRWGDRDVSAIDKGELDKLVLNLEKRPGRDGEHLSNGTINRYLSAASALLTFAYEKGYIPAVPPVPWQQETGSRILYLTEAEEKTWRAWLGSAGYHAESLSMAFLAASGMRWGEFERLVPADIGDPRPIGRVRACIVNIDRTKTDVPRRVPMDPALGLAMRSLLVEQARPVYRLFRERLQKCRDACGGDPGFTVHCLRHTTATRLAERGKNAEVIRKLLGHRSLATTMKYIHMSDPALAEHILDENPRLWEVDPTGTFGSR